MSIRYTLKEGFSGFRRQKLAALGSILTITIALLLLGMFYLVTVQSSKALQQIRSKVDVEVFLLEPVSKNKLVEIQKQIQNIEGIAKTEYVSKDDAATIFKQEFGEDINKVLDFNPLPPSFKITLYDSYRTSDRVEGLQAKLKTINGIDDVVYRKDMIEFFDSRTKGLNILALVLGIFLAFSAITLVSNSIRLTIVARKQSIQIMKLVGATPWFIRSPFLIEGILLGLFGGVFAAGLLFYFTTITKNLLPSEISGIFHADLTMYGILLIVGMGLGFLGSLFAARKYIRESVI